MNLKQIFTLTLISIFFLLSLSLASAKNIALAVKDSTSLDPIHEQKLYDILQSLNQTVTLIDQNSNVTYSNFDLLVVAGRPPTAAPLPDSFARNLPVNSMPTIAIDYYNLYPWGWVDSGGVNAMFSGSAQSVFISSMNHPITAGYLPNQRVFVHNQTGLVAIDIVVGTSNFTFVAYLDQQGDGAIAFASPNTRLVGGKIISNNSVSVFFGTMSPGYWTVDAENMFKNAVNWVTHLDYTPPTTTTLSGPSTTRSGSAQYTWTAATGTNGIQGYQIQVSLTSDFTAITLDKKTSSLSYTVTGMRDGQTYYVRVRAIDYLNLQGPWSNTVSTTADFSGMIFTIISPLNGTVLHLGDTIFTDVSIDAPRLLDGSNCVITMGEDFVANIPYSQALGKCSANITIPTTLGVGGLLNCLFTVSATNSLGSTGSSSITVFLNRSFSVSLSTDKSSYNSGETVTASGYVTMNDNGAKVKNASVKLSLGSFNETKQTDSNGFYSFTISGLSDGSYIASVNAVYNSVSVSNSASFSISAPASSSSQSSSSSGGYSGYTEIPIISIEGPDKITAYENSDKEFSVRINNEGTALLRGAKVDVTGIEADVSPYLTEIASNRYQDFKIILHVPSGTGDKEISLKALGYGAMAKTKKIILTVLPQPLVPVLKITQIELSTFTEGEQGNVNMTIENTGDATATATISILLPTGWSVAESEKTSDVLPKSQQKISFLIMPSKESGQLTFTVKYQANNEEKQISESKDVTVNPKQETMSITGMLTSAVASPAFYIPASLVAALILIRVWKKRMIRVGMPVKTSTNGNGFNISRRKINPASNYLQWERKHKRL